VAHVCASSGADGAGHRWSAGAPSFRVTVLGVTTPPNGAGDARTFCTQNWQCASKPPLSGTERRFLPPVGALRADSLRLARGWGVPSTLRLSMSTVAPTKKPAPAWEDRDGL